MKVRVARGPKNSCVRAVRAIARGETALVLRGRRVVSRPGRHTLEVGPGRHLVVDAPGRFVNHSCDPNCRVRGRAALVARRAIAAGEEITFDYETTERALAVPLRGCLCGSPRCRGTVRGSGAADARAVRARARR